MAAPKPPAPLPEPPTVSLRKRAGTRLLLALFLLASVVGGAGGLIVIALGGGLPDTLETVPTASSRLPQRVVFLALLGLFNAGSAVGMWSFRRWGVYGVVCASLMAFMVNLKIGGVQAAAPGLIGVSLLSVFAMSIWIEFD